MIRFRSIRSKFILLISSLVILTTGIFVGIVINLHRQNLSKVEEMNTALMTTALQEEWEDRARSLTTLLAKKFVQPMYELDVAEMSYLANLAMEEEDLRYVYVQDKNGRVLVDATDGSKLLGKVPTDELAMKALAADDLIIQGKADIVDVAAPIGVGAARMGIVRIGFSTEGIQETAAVMNSHIGDSIDRAVYAAIRNTFLLLPVVLIPALVVGWIITRGLTLPLKQLVRGTQRVARGDLSYRVEGEARDEVGQLVASFNKMTEDLQETTVSKEYVDNIIKSMTDTLVVTSPDATIQMVNRATCDVLGYTPDELIGQPMAMIFADEEKRRKGQAIGDVIEKGAVRNVEKVYLTKDGRRIHVLFSGSVMRGDDGEIEGVVCVATDITARKRAEEALRSRARQEATIAEIGQRALAGVDLQELMVETVARVAQTLGVEYCKVLELLPDGNAMLLRAGVGWKEGCVGRATVGAGNDSQAGYTLNTSEPVIVEDLRTETRFNGPPLLHDHGVISGMSVIIYGKDGPFGVLGAHTTLRRAFTRDDVHFLQAIANVLADAIERKRMEETISQMAYYDALTALPNRTLFKDRLRLAIAHARRYKQMLAVLFLDLDRFKAVNDTLGHTMGDQLLKDVAERLVKCVREDDTVTRLGGDEFTLLLPGIDKTENAARVAGKILRAIRTTFTLDGNELHITTSIGVALYPSDGRDAEALLKNADVAMYHAKKQGRNNYQLYTPALHARVFEQLKQEASLRNALERKELVLYYQPQVNINTRQIVGMEALVRWRHPELGLLPPTEFIPLAEETGLIVPIGEWVLRTACAQNKAWQEAGLPPMRVAVNLSARQFQRNLVEMVSRTLKETALAPNFLELEITESVALEDVDFTTSVLQELKNMGVHITLDDFGVGVYSISYLKRFPIDTLKIDRSFVRSVTTNSDDVTIVRAIISLARGLKLNVIPEGVENEEQLAFFKQQRCDEVQGHLFGKPLSTDEFEKMLSQGRPTGGRS